LGRRNLQTLPEDIRLEVGKRNKATRVPAILSLAEHSDYTKSEIARMVGVKPATVSECLRRYNVKLKKSIEFKRHKSIILNGVQERIVSKITDSKIDDANLQSTISSLKMLHEMERLENNQSTSNVAVKSDIPEALLQITDRIVRRAE